MKGSVKKDLCYQSQKFKWRIFIFSLVTKEEKSTNGRAVTYDDLNSFYSVFSLFSRVS